MREKEKNYNDILDYLIEDTYKNNLETLNTITKHVEFAKELYDYCNKQFETFKKTQNETQESVQQ